MTPVSEEGKEAFNLLIPLRKRPGIASDLSILLSTTPESAAAVKNKDALFSSGPFHLHREKSRVLLQGGEAFVLARQNRKWQNSHAYI